MRKLVFLFGMILGLGVSVLYGYDIDGSRYIKGDEVVSVWKDEYSNPLYFFDDSSKKQKPYTRVICRDRKIEQYFEGDWFKVWGNYGRLDYNGACRYVGTDEDYVYCSVYMPEDEGDRELFDVFVQATIDYATRFLKKQWEKGQCETLNVENEK